jgi:hypothetical protein
MEKRDQQKNESARQTEVAKAKRQRKRNNNTSEQRLDEPQDR